MWYLFPISAVNRMLARSHQFPPGWIEKLNDIFGASDWRNAFYSVSQDGVLFDGTESIVKTAGWNAIMNYIIKRLKAEFAKVAEEPKYLMNPKNNAPLFLLCFAAAAPGRGSELAVKIAQQILDKN